MCRKPGHIHRMPCESNARIVTISTHLYDLVATAAAHTKQVLFVSFVSFVQSPSSRSRSCKEARLGALRLLAGVVEMLCYLHHGLNVIVAQPFATLTRQQLCRLEDVLDLASIHIEARESLNIFLRHRVWQGAVVMKLPCCLIDLRW